MVDKKLDDNQTIGGILKNITDDRMKNNWIVVSIKHHTIFLSSVIIAILILFICFSYIDLPKSNNIIINPHEGSGIIRNNTIPGWSTAEKFSVRNTPINEIEIKIEHKKRLTYSDDLNIKTIKILISKDGSDDIKDIRLSLKSPNSEVINCFNFSQTDFIGQYLDNIIIYKVYDENWPIKPDSNNIIHDIYYTLEYDNYNKHTITIEGTTETNSPIRYMDSVEEMDNSINISLYRLTLIMIVIGVFSFFTYLKKLLDDEN